MTLALQGTWERVLTNVNHVKSAKITDSANWCCLEPFFDKKYSI